MTPVGIRFAVPRLTLVCALAAAALAGACDLGDPGYEVEAAPPVAVLEVRATTELLPVTGVDGPAFVPIQTPVNPDGSTDGVLPTSSITIRFDRFLEHESVLRQSFCLQASTADVVDPNGCIEGRVFLEPSYDPVLREVKLRLGKGDPATPEVPLLKVDTLHTLTIFAPVAGSQIEFGIRAFDGAPLASKLVYRFKTGPDDPDAPDEVELDTDRFCLGNECVTGGAATPAVTACQAACMDEACVRDCCKKSVACLDGRDPSPTVLACRGACAATDSECLDACCGRSVSAILRDCSFPGCHQANPGQGLTADAAAMGLRLDSGATIALTAIGKVAKQTMTGENADQPDRSSQRFGRAMPIIDPKNAGNSYLLLKMLAHLDYERSAGTPGPEEYLRLRNGLVVGMPMPANRNSTNPRPPDQTLRDLLAVSEWIAAGAPTECK